MTREHYEFKDRLQLIIGEESVSSFGRRCNISESSLRTSMQGALPRLDKLIAIAEAANVNIEWLATGEGPMRPGQESLIVKDIESGKDEVLGVVHCEDDIEQTPQPHTNIPQWEQPDTDAFHYVPMAKAKLSAGGGMFVLSEDVSDYYAFRKKWLNRIATSPKNVVLMEVQGNSMAPTILDKDTVLIDTGRMEIIEGMIYAIRLDHTIMIKRLTHRPGGIINVISDNKEEFEPYQANRKDIHIIGQIIFFSRDLISGY